MVVAVKDKSDAGRWQPLVRGIRHIIPPISIIWSRWQLAFATGFLSGERGKHRADETGRWTCKAADCQP